MGLDRFGAEDLAKALAEGSAAAYKAVGNPVEGTMLTVIREMSEAPGRKPDAERTWSSCGTSCARPPASPSQRRPTCCRC